MKTATAVAFALLLTNFALPSVAEEVADPRTAKVTAEALHKELKDCHDTPLVVDVREPHEFEAGHIEGALLAPLGGVIESLSKVDRNRDIVLVCRSGNRSGKAQKILAEQGFTKLRNMEGGMIAWGKLGYPVAK